MDNIYTKHVFEKTFADSIITNISVGATKVITNHLI